MYQAMVDSDFLSYAQLCQFVREQGRLPRLDDPIPAYRYAGWALPMIWEGHRVLPRVPNRWGYHLDILHARRIPDAPIPQIEFLHTPHRDTLTHLQRWVTLAAEHQSSWTGLTNLIAWIAFSLKLNHVPPSLADNTQAALYQAVNLQELVLHPYDYWGDIIAEGIGRGPWANPNGFYPTPMSVCQLIVRMMLPDADSLSPAARNALRVKSIADPAGSGTGRMLLLASNVSLSLYGIERDAVVRTACLINGALYAPWLAFPLPQEILHATDAEHGLTNQASLLSVATPIPEEISLIPPINDAVDHEDLQLVFPGW